MHAGIGKRAVDENAVAGIGHVGELGDVVAAEQIVELVLPAGAGLVSVMRPFSFTRYAGVSRVPGKCSEAERTISGTQRKTCAAQYWFL